MDEKKDVIEIDLIRLMRVLLEKVWIIVLAGVIGGVLLLGYAKFFMTPMYSANAMFYVNNANTDTYSTSQLQAAQYLADTYMVILESRSVMDAVAQQTGLDYNQKELIEMVSASAVNDTEVFKVVVTCANAQHAAKIANAIADVLPGKLAEVVEGSSMRIVDRAVVNDQRVSPSYSKMLVLGAVLGVALCAIAVIVKDLLDDSIRGEDYLQRAYSDIPLLAVVPEGEISKGGYYTSFSQKKKTRPAGGAK